MPNFVLTLQQTVPLSAACCTISLMGALNGEEIRKLLAAAQSSRHLQNASYVEALTESSSDGPTWHGEFLYAEVVADWPEEATGSR